LGEKVARSVVNAKPITFRHSNENRSNDNDNDNDNDNNNIKNNNNDNNSTFSGRFYRRREIKERRPLTPWWGLVQFQPSTPTFNRVVVCLRNNNHDYF